MMTATSTLARLLIVLIIVGLLDARLPTVKLDTEAYPSIKVYCSSFCAFANHLVHLQGMSYHQLVPCGVIHPEVEGPCSAMYWPEHYC